MRVIQNTTVFDGPEVREEKYVTGLIPDEKNQEMCVVNLYPEKEYQKIEGFGAALTEAAGYAVSSLPPDRQEELMKLCYGPDGLNYTIGRVHMDSCDFSLGNYSASEEMSGPDFPDFSLSRDREYVLPLIAKAENAAGKPVRLLLSPWSPPAFMKDTGTRNGGGHLRRDMYALYAAYIVRYIREYRREGADIACMTIQNEPLAVQTWDSCEYTAGEEKEFLRDYLYPAMKAAGLTDVGIYIWDHNKERAYERACDIIDDDTRPMIEGVAFHWYTGDHFETLQLVREDFPELKLIHSEGCVELLRKDIPSGDENEQAFRYAHDLIGDLNGGMNRWYDWNLALDEKGGPNHVGNYCAAPVHCDTQKGTFRLSHSYYAIAHFSRYIMPGAVRIGKSVYTQDIEVTAAKNPDGSIAAVLMNRTDRPKFVNLRVLRMTTRLVLPAKSIQTLVIE